MFLVPYRSRPSRDEYIDAEVVVEETERPDDPVTIYVVPPNLGSVPQHSSSEVLPPDAFILSRRHLIQYLEQHGQ